jgi:ABC-type nitrate/sulfonate/bicarbonate transport system ATPase subunit
VIILSKRPGRIIEELTVTLKRPRKLEDRFAPQFGELALHARECISAQI